MKFKIFTTGFVMAIIFICSGLILFYLFIAALLPILGTGGWNAVFFPIILLVFFLGVVEIIYGFIILFTNKINVRKKTYFGVVSLSIGLVYILLQWWLVWYLILFLFISGILMFSLDLKNESPKT